LPFDRNWDNNRAEANASVVEGASDLGSGNLNPVPGDPTPGQTMLWEFDYGNNQPVASGLAVITGTLPLSTSVVDWYSQNGFGGWQEITSEPGLLVLGAPGIPSVLLELGFLSNDADRANMLDPRWRAAASAAIAEALLAWSRQPADALDMTRN